MFRFGSGSYVGAHFGHDASVCIMPGAAAITETDILLKERFTRIKHDTGHLDILALLIPGGLIVRKDRVAGNPSLWEPLIGPSAAAVRDMLKSYDGFVELAGTPFLSPTYPHARRLTHHYCHARAAVALSPFENALVLVNDGSGDLRSAFPPDHEEILKFSRATRASPGEAAEFYTVYRQSGSRLDCVMKEWQNPGNVYDLIDGPGFRGRRSMGVFYYGSSLYVFNAPWQEGKVMGLAAYGHPEALKIGRKEDFFIKLGREKRFLGRGKREWENSGRFEHYADVAAAVQGYFEKWLLELAADLKRRFPEEENLILTGGCALNCAANMKLAEAGLFSSIYVPPFPGDDSIAFGAASGLRYGEFGEPWRPLSWESQTASFGSAKSAPEEKACRKVFQGWETRRLNDPAAAAAWLAKGKIIAWFQGRSESGPRALGCRSLLADPSRPGMKDRLNGFVKGRESFRPYGCSVIWEEAAEYFDVPRGFESPFMSFTPRVREPYRDRLKEIVHADGTSRIQTVRLSQNPLFYRLLEEMKRRTGVGCVLNTSLNVMGEPIVETLADLRRFLEKTPVDAAVAGNLLISNRSALGPDEESGRLIRRAQK